MDAMPGTKFTGQEVVDYITEKLAPVVDGDDVNLFAAAAIGVILTALRPQLTSTELVDGVGEITAYIGAYVGTLGAPKGGDA